MNPDIYLPRVVDLFRVVLSAALNAPALRGGQASCPDMKTLRRLTLSAVFVVTFLMAQGANAQVGDRHEEVDKLFARYQRPGSPGCALAIIRDGKILYKHGYGLANLEYAAPIQPDTIFHVASVSNGRVRKLSFERAQTGFPPRTTESLAKVEMSGTFHLSRTEPEKRLIFHGKTGLIKINNIGPGGLVVKNSKNNMTLGAHTTMDLVFEDDTVLSIDRPNSSHQTHGTFEISSK